MLRVFLTNPPTRMGAIYLYMRQNIAPYYRSEHPSVHCFAFFFCKKKTDRKKSMMVVEHMTKHPFLCCRFESCVLKKNRDHKLIGRLVIFHITCADSNSADLIGVAIKGIK